ncbi:MAG TPA: hypothetical protein VLA77_00655 [Candidatus Saccharimonadales bacterium]|nr:hypothetical protein [Candidatus Saccharimonadales bacterium]
MSTLEKPGYNPNSQKQPKRKGLGARFMGMFGGPRTNEGPQPTDEELYGPTPEHLKTDAERAKDAKDAEVRDLHAEGTAKRVTETYQNPRSWYNRGIDSANEYKKLAVDATYEGDINKAVDYTKTMREHQNQAIKEVENQMDSPYSTGHSQVGKQEVMDKLHEHALKQAEQEGVDIKTPDDSEK